MSTIRNANKLWATVLALSAGAVWACAPCVSHADFLPVYGGPTFPPDPRPGEIGYNAFLGSTIRVNDAGTAVATPHKSVYINDFAGWYGQGTRAMRWDASATPIELGHVGTGPGGSTHVTVSAINEAGTVVGGADKYNASGDSVDGGAVRWEASGTAATELGKPSGFLGGLARAINDVGTIVGEAERYGSTDPPSDPLGMRALRWGVSGTITELGHLGAHANGWAYSSASAINNAGTVIGASNKITRSNIDVGRRAVRWSTSATAPTELNNLGTRSDGYAFTEAFAINVAGTAVGVAEKYDAAGNYVGLRPVRWDPSGAAVTELGGLGPQPGGGVGGGMARAINDAGTIVGGVSKYDTAGNYLGSFAVRWDASSTVATELGNLGTDPFGYINSYALAINDAGTAVGQCNAPDTPGLYGWRAVYFRAEDGAAIDLNTLIDPASGWLLTEASSISNTGWIVGMGLYYPAGSEAEDAYFRHYLIHVPATAVVPEPASGLILGTGTAVLGLLLVRCRRPRCTDLHTKKNGRAVALALSIAMLLTCASRVARAGIFKWEYVNPTDPGQGKQPSTMLCPDGAGANAVPGTNLSNRNLTMAYLISADLGPFEDEFATYYSDLTGATLIQADLTNANLYGATLTNTNLSQANLANASFYFANLTGANLAGAEVREANFNLTGITPAQLYSTASYQAHDLTGISLLDSNLAGVNLADQKLTNADLGYATLSGANLRGANLTNTNFYRATLSGANLTGAEVRGANFEHNSLEGGITPAQLYSTASYQAHNLTAIGLTENNFAGVNLVGQNLTNARFHGATLTNANFSQANLTGADFGANSWAGANLSGANLSGANLTNASFSGLLFCDESECWPSPGADLTGANLNGADARRAIFQNATLTGANFSNLIQADGHIAGLQMTAGASLVVRDYDGNPVVASGPLPIVVDQQLAMDATGTLRLVFDADAWDSTISFAVGIPVTRAGTLELLFAPDVNLAAQIGRTIDLFDWTGVTPTGAFTVSSPYTWNLASLYTTGEVTLTAVPGLVPGDFNHDGTVDAADYVVWRKSDGTPNDYNVWRAHFGQTLGGGASSTANSSSNGSSNIPEPASLLLLIMGCFAAGLVRESRRLT